MAFRRATRKPEPITTDESVVADIEEARRQKSVASEEYRQVVMEGYGVSRMAAEFREARTRNGFGKRIEISFTPKERRSA